MNIQIDLEDNRYCDTCKLRRYSEKYEVFNCAMGYWADDAVETGIDKQGEVMDYCDDDCIATVHMRPQKCKDNHDAPPGDIYEFYLHPDDTNTYLYHIDKEQAEVSGLLNCYRRANLKTYTIKGWEEYLTYKLVDFTAIPRSPIKHCIAF